MGLKYNVNTVFINIYNNVFVSVKNILNYFVRNVSLFSGGGGRVIIFFLLSARGSQFFPRFLGEGHIFLKIFLLRK